MKLATIMADERRIDSLNRPDTYGKEGRLRKNNAGWWGGDTLAMFSEIAVADYLNLFWDGSLGNVHGIDVGGLVEVRNVERQSLHLILHPEEKHKYELPYVKVVSNPPMIWLCGWIFMKDGLDPSYMENHGFPANYVPNDRLRPMHELKDWVEQNRHLRIRVECP